MLALLPMLGAVLGAWLDERHHAGFSQWRSACRAAGLSLNSLAAFTWQLLPGALAGALVGGLALQMLAITWRGDRLSARAGLAAHLGCTLAMPLGILLCALALPLGVTLVTEALLAALAGVLLLRVLSPAPSAHP
jgi:hypothetical protein